MVFAAQQFHVTDRTLAQAQSVAHLEVWSQSSSSYRCRYCFCMRGHHTLPLAEVAQYLLVSFPHGSLIFNDRVAVAPHVFQRARLLHFTTRGDAGHRTQIGSPCTDSPFRTLCSRIWRPRPCTWCNASSPRGRTSWPPPCAKHPAESRLLFPGPETRSSDTLP